KKTFTKPLPKDAEVFTRRGERRARWNQRGKTRTAALTRGRDGADRLLLESPFYVAQYRDGTGLLQVVSTGCRDENAARQGLADLERRAELVRARVMTATEAAVSDHQATPLAEHFQSYLASLEAKGACKEHRSERDRQLHRLAAECSFGLLAD